nr:reverse transcriptase domain-containing protein [Tanacetum cinerariifolium]
MVACLEKTKENAEFHQIVDFLSKCPINYALTVSLTIYASYIKQFWNTAISKTVNSVKQIHVIVDGKAVVISESSMRSDILFNAEDGDDSVERAITTDASLVTTQDSDNIAMTQSKTISIDPISQEISSGHIVRSGEDRMEQETNLTDFIPPTPHDLPLSGGHTPRSDEGRPNLLELMNICTTLSNRVLALEEAKTIQDKVIIILKLRVRMLEKKRKSRTSQPMKRRLFKGRVKTFTDKRLGEDASKQRRNDDQTEELNLTNGADTEVITEDNGSGEKGGSTADQVSTARPEVSAATPSTPPTTTTIFGDEDLTIAQTLIKMMKPESKDKKDKRIKRVTDSAPKQKSSKKQKMMQEQESAKSDEEESADIKHENEELRIWLTVVLDEEETVDPEILSTKYPIVDWESQILGNVDMEDKHVYKIIRANGNTSYHKSLSSMLRKFDRQDLVDLHRLVMKRFEDNTPEGIDMHNLCTRFEDPKEGPKEDRTDYPADGGDDDDYNDDDKEEEEEEEAFKEEEDKEEKHLALADSAAPRPSPPRSTWTKALIDEFASAPTPPSPPPSLLSPWSSLLQHIPFPPLHVLSPPLPLSSPRTHTGPPYVDAPLGYKAAVVQWRAASPIPIPSPPLLFPSSDHKDDILEASDDRVGEVNERVTDLATTQRQDAQELHVCCEDTQDDQALLRAQKMLPKKTTITPMTDAAIKALIAQGVANALAEYEAHRSSGNGDDSHDFRSGRRTEHATYECTYSDFLKCQHLNFKTAGQDAAYRTTWKTLRKMMTDKYCPRMMCGRMFPEESNVVEKYVDELPDMIQGSVKASKPNTRKDAIEFATELMDQKLHTFANRQAKNNRKFDDNSRNNQTQQQPFKRKNIARAYTVGPGEKKENCMMVVKEIVSRLLKEDKDKEGDDGSKVREFDDLNNGKGSITWQKIVWMQKDTKDGLAKQGNDNMRM